MHFRHILFALLSTSPTATVASTTPGPTDWVTPAEASGYTRTPRYAETMAYFERLDAASDGITMRAFGSSPQGRALNAVIVASDGIDTPAEAQASGKPVVLIQAAIHPGENEGKDVLMALARDLTVTGKYAALREAAVLVLVPIFNVDGHERFSPYNRINQNGPEAMGWRGTATHLNLNRDYVKADTPEMQAWLRLWREWQPDLLIDLHNTNGADYQYALTWAFETAQNIDPALAAWNRRFFDSAIKPALDAQGWPVAFYVSLKDGTDLQQGLLEGASSPRFSVGYAAANNRPGLLVETHMLKDFRTRVAANEALLLALLKQLQRDGGALQDANAEADARRFAEGENVPLAFGLSDRTETVDFLGYAYTRTPSDVSGDAWVQYNPTQPRTYRLPVQREVTITAEAATPAAYAVPPQWQELVERLDAHGIHYTRLDAEKPLTAGQYRFGKATWATTPFEGRLVITGLEQTLETVEATLPPGTVIVPMNQPKQRLIAALLEPASPDSWLRWGGMNAVFEEKEYAEPRVIEAMARDMLARDASLKAEFESRLANDAAFAADPAQRLRFFYQRTPYFDAETRRYPVLRLDAETLSSLRPEN